MTLSDVATSVADKFPVKGKVEFRGETTLIVDRALIHDVCSFCKIDLGFDYLLDISSVDNFGEEPRFQVVYELYSFASGLHLRLKISVSEDELEVPTVSDIWATANWHEREVFDMMGITFAGHPDLRRIIMWDGYPVLPAAQRFPARRQGKRCARGCFHKSRAAGRRAVRDSAERRDRQGSRAARAALGLKFRESAPQQSRKLFRASQRILEHLAVVQRAIAETGCAIC